MRERLSGSVCVCTCVSFQQGGAGSSPDRGALSSCPCIGLFSSQAINVAAASKSRVTFKCRASSSCPRLGNGLMETQRATAAGTATKPASFPRCLELLGSHTCAHLLDGGRGWKGREDPQAQPLGKGDPAGPERTGKKEGEGSAIPCCVTLS